MNGRKLRWQRDMSGLTQWQLARLSGVDRSVIAFCESAGVSLTREQVASIRAVLSQKLRERTIAIARELDRMGELAAVP